MLGGKQSRGSGTTEAVDHLAFLLRSENRLSVLEVLSQTASERWELQRETDAPRSTLARVLTELEERGWVERDGTEYRATVTGRLIADELLETMEAIETIERVERVLEELPTEIRPPDASVLSGARVTVTKPGSPLGPVRRFEELLEASETLREYNVTALGRASGRGVDETFDDLSGTVVYPTEVVRGLLESSEPFVRAFHNRRLQVRVLEEQSFGIALFDDRIALVGYEGRTCAPASLLDTAAPAARQWGEEVFESYCSQSTALERSDLDIPTKTSDAATHDGIKTAADTRL